ncbi:MAG: ribonuclease toxin brnt of type ii toxin-antitoxin system [Verrucomicrobiales bacterium]|nr:ribonuclease toxin brnt of type ii toxin-antitoxin system [Verrucomicrobiales bacterium]
MDFDWNNLPFNLDSSIKLQEIEESFEDPFAVRLLPDSPRFSVQARFFNLGVSASGNGIFTVYRTNGKQVRVIFARSFQPEEQFYYQRKMNAALAQ